MGNIISPNISVGDLVNGARETLKVLSRPYSPEELAASNDGLWLARCGEVFAQAYEQGFKAGYHQGSGDKILNQCQE